jgi:photosystem II stability/assembly factor-like uncharacterized protein
MEFLLKYMMKHYKENTMIIKKLLICSLILSTALLLPAAAAGNDGYQEIINTFKMRNIGPATMGGRTVDFAVVENNTSIIYAAVGPSGLWKSTDNGITWFPVFENQTSVSVGAVSVSTSQPDTVWVGTGEATSRNSVAIGDGVYKSEDAGKTWNHMGLEETRHIDRILIDPNNPDIVYVGAMGHLWGPNQERGVFKTIDGGKTWKKVLYFDEDTGIADMVMDPANSRTIYAAAYNHRRKPFLFTSGGPHSGIYKTTNRGETWKQLKNGLPDGVNGRCGLSVCKTRPEVIYAAVENKDGGIFRSEDKGETWKRMCDKKTYDKVNFRPFYYSKITVDPNNDLVIYAYSGRAYISEDGGKTFKEIGKELHPDHHRIWVDPNDSNHIIDGNDGGIDISWDRGQHWYAVQNATLSEVYQLTFDMREPYYVYVGLQDNGSWAGPTNSLEKKGIMNVNWYPVGGGDGFYVQVDPRDHNILFRNLQMGNIERFHQGNGQTLSIIPWASLDEEPYRFNWNSPIHLSPHNPDILYLGGNFLFKSTDRGNSWEKISPDLSSNDPGKIIDSGGPISPDNTGAEVHCTIYTICESPVKTGIIWTGTDDGNLWVTRDNGKNWANVTKNIKELPPSSWVSRVEASHFAEGTVFVTFDRHRWDDYAPYVYKSDNFGATWVSLRNNLPKTGYLHVIREDINNPQLLYLGSGFGLFFSFNGGKQWIPYKKEFPTIAVRDIGVHPREKDLIVGTHGRGVWIMDDIAPLQQLNAEVLNKGVHLFAMRPATIYFERKGTEYYAKPVFSAPNPPFGAAISYYLKEKTGKDQAVHLYIYDQTDKKIRTLAGTGEKGLNRVYWDLRAEPPFKELPPMLKGDAVRWFGIPKGPFVLPGTYKVALEYQEQKLEKEILVKKDKNLDYPVDEWKKNHETVLHLGEFMAKGYKIMGGIKTLDDQLQKLGKELKENKSTQEPVMKEFNRVCESLDEIKSVFFPKGTGEGTFRKPLKIALQGGALPEQVFKLYMGLSSYPGKPTETQEKQMQEIFQKLTPIFMKTTQLMEADIPGLNRLLRENGVDFIKVPKLE